MYSIRKRPVYSIILLIILIPLGFLLAAGIKKGEEKRVDKFKREVILIKDKGRMADLKNGEFIAEGNIVALDPQSLPEIPGRYISLRKIEEKYTHHTRIRNTTDSEGRSHSHVESYYSWDRIGVWEYKASRVSFLGREFKIEDINFSHSPYPDNSLTRKIDKNTRYVYYTYPESTPTGILKGRIENGIPHNLVFKKDRTITKEVEKMMKRGRKEVIGFWATWSLLCIIGLFLVWKFIRD